MSAKLLTQENEDILKELVDKGFTRYEIGQKLGVHEVTIGRWCKKLGIKPQGYKKRRLDLSNKRSGNLLFIKQVGVSKDRHILWECLCDCGNSIVTSSSNFNVLKNCGKCKTYVCKGKITSKSKTRLFKIWNGMKSRCSCPSVNSYELYGGKGISVCQEWMDFDNFYNWSMSNGYSDGLSIDRIDIELNYNPSNCRWVTIKEQGRNKSNSRLIEYNGETKCLSEWSELLNIRRDTLARRIDDYGWSIGKAFSTPVRNRKDK